MERQTACLEVSFYCFLEEGYAIIELFTHTCRELPLMLTTREGQELKARVWLRRKQMDAKSRMKKFAHPWTESARVAVGRAL
jgi:hypothetical protein